jgi:hypothetical protein
MRDVALFAAGVFAGLLLVLIVDEGGRHEYPTAAEWRP